MRSVDAALHFSEKRQAENLYRICPANIKNDRAGRLQIISYKDLNKDAKDKVLVCENMRTKPLSEFQTCNFDSTMPTAVTFYFN